MAISSREVTMDASRSKILGGALAVVLLLLLHVTPTAGASPLAGRMKPTLAADVTMADPYP
jgi:hypothetical protein